MEPYIIEVKIRGENQLIFVDPTEEMDGDGRYSYKVCHAGYWLGNIFADVDENVDVNWHTIDLIAHEIVNNIGKQIESKDL